MTHPTDDRKLALDALEWFQKLIESAYVACIYNTEPHPVKMRWFVENMLKEATTQQAAVNVPREVVEALKFYAERHRHLPYNPILDEGAYYAHLRGTAKEDQGKIAREALALLEKHMGKKP